MMYWQKYTIVKQTSSANINSYLGANPLWQHGTTLHSCHEKGNQCIRMLRPSLDAVWPSSWSEVTLIFSKTAGACQQIIKRKHRFQKTLENGCLPLYIIPCTSKQWIINKTDLKHCDLLAFNSKCKNQKCLLLWAWTWLLHILMD